jgi:crotonobetainyl-CoA:carnitine CoA-transferase CaiB-like acyl-CoA transferase
MVAQGMGGGMSITGAHGGPPVRAGIPIGDLGGGVFGALGVLAALHARTVTGRGQHVDVSMLDVQISMLNYMATMHFLSGKNPAPIGNAHFVHVPYDAFRTRTRFLIIAIITDNFWQALVELLELPELASEEYRRQPGRLANKDAINEAVQRKLATDTCEYWLERLRERRIPCAPVNDFEHALTDPQVVARNMVIEVGHPSGGSVRMPGNPVKMSDTGDDDFTPPPLIGQQTDQVLSEFLGLNPGEIARLRTAQVIG